MASVRVKGLDQVIANLNSEIGNIEGATVGGLLAAGLIIQAEAQGMTPVDTGNLKDSAFTRKAPENEFAVEIGFSAAYAIYVHEDLDAYHEVGQAKFLEVAVENKQQEALQVIAQHVKVKKRARQ